MARRTEMPILSEDGQHALDGFLHALQETEDLRPATLRNYASDLRQFVAWCEAHWATGQETGRAFTPTAVTTPLITAYRTSLQSLALRPASINRFLVSIKRYCAWARDAQIIARDPAKPVKLVPEVEQAPRHLADEDEQALMRAVTEQGTLRDQTLITVLLHTGLRAHEICSLQVQQVKIGKRSGTLEVIGKGNKYREIPLNITAREALKTYLATLPRDAMYVFTSHKTNHALSERGLNYLIKKYTNLAKLHDVHPHDLRHRFGYRMAQVVPLHRLAQIMGHDSLDTTMRYIKATKSDLQHEIEKIAWA
jgi:integrase/recombinase XerD